jgi:2-polyprenyl-3-methyl-5-hydroxy-6-metoxy-1,4-benzoquinol methylase
MKKQNLVLETKKLYRGLGWPSLFTLIRFFTAPYKRLEKMLPQKGVIIDLGCGYGIFSNFLALTGPEREVIGIELDKGKVKFADRGLKNTCFLNADITKIKIKKADALLLVHVLHHLNSFPEQEKLIKICFQKLKKNGQLVIVEVDKRPYFKYLLGYLADRALYPGDKIYYRLPRQMKALLTKLGLNFEIKVAHQGKPFAHMIYLVNKI